MHNFLIANALELVMVEESQEWRIVCPEIDETSGSIGRFLKGIWPERVTLVHPRDGFASSDKKYFGDFLSQIRRIRGRLFTVYGSGYYHHFTCGLVKSLAGKVSDFSYVHIDEHSDNSDIENGVLNCGNFVNRIESFDAVSSVKYVGCGQVFKKVREKDILPASKVRRKTLNDSLTSLLQDSADDVYVSSDLDVLLPSQMYTNYPEGHLYASVFLDCLRFINDNKNIVGADALGLAEFVDTAYSREKKHVVEASFFVYAMIAGILFGEDISEFKKAHSKLTKSQ